jgi:hypothetical protein
MLISFYCNLGPGEKINFWVLVVLVAHALLFTWQAWLLRSSIKDAKETSIQQEKNTNVVNRPYMNLYKGAFSFNSNSISPTVNFMNHGLTPAINIRLECKLIVIKNGTDRVEIATKNMSWPLAGANETVGVNIIDKAISFDEKSETAQMIGLVKYEDGWGQCHAMEFSRTNAIGNPDGFEVGSTGDRHYDTKCISKP